MTKILNPLLILPAVALLAAVAAGLIPLWRAGNILVTQALATRAQQVAAKKAQGRDFWTVEIDNLASELKEEKARLKKQADQLELRAARLDAEQQELEKMRASVEATEKEIDERVIAIAADESKNLRTLAQTYTNLTPRAAVAIIREMDDTTVVKILSLMKPDVVAPIFEEMSHTPDKDGLLSRRVALLSEKLRLMKSNKPASSS
jgi:flagellar motility protein MotE (MotC chaperone)